MWNEAKWLKVPVEEIQRKKIYHGDMTGRFAYFRCEIDLPEKAFLTVDISASSRYRLWVNGKPVLSGPCKGDVWRQYYETIELTGLLLPGKNVFCVQVLYNDPNTAEIQTDERAAVYGVMGVLAGHRLAVEGDVYNEDGTVAGTLTTGRADWRVWLDNSFCLKSSDITCYLGAVTEKIDFSSMPVHWKEEGFDAFGWIAAEAADTVLPTNILFSAGVQPRFRIRQREIPLLYEKEDRFERDFSRADGNTVGLLAKGSITVEPEQALELILDAGVVKNGYPRYIFQGGKGEKVTITYFEKFGGQGSDLRRTDYENGEISGLTDTIYLAGGEICYEPFWVRTFRFVRISIQAREEPVTLLAPDFRRTGYPLEVTSYIQASDPWVERLWEICVRTLENCMMETYMDCPYYEQLQFAMDTRLEALFTYAVSNDHALARKALIDFHYGMQPEGLTAGKYPSAYLQILSTFSLHYIYMLWEYYQQTGDKETIRFCRGDVDRILDYFDARIGAEGLVGRLEFWEFVDWQPDWSEFAGIPRALQQGPSTIINLMYAYALFCGGTLFAAMGRNSLAEEYLSRREAILGKVQSLCWDQEKGMYREGPECRQFTQHAQSWAVLNGLSQGENARRILARAIEDGECLKCSFSTAYEWFRALEKAGMYEVMRDSLNDWIALLELDCTTCPETPKQARSECHAWSALPMYEMMRTMAGVTPEGIGWERIRITPHTMDLDALQGRVTTPKGNISFRYEKKDGVWHYSLELPEGMDATFIYPDGRKEHLNRGKGVAKADREVLIYEL